MDRPRLLRKEEFGSLLRLMDTVFPSSAPFAEKQDHLFTGREQDLKQHIVFEKNGEIVSHLGLFTREICIGSSVVKAGGVGSVATYEKYCGQGFMNRMFAAAFEIMKHEEYDISVLGGDRKRYNTFGYEQGGRRLAFLVTDRFVKGMSFEGLSVRKYAGDSADLEALMAIHEREYFKTRRDGHFYDKLYKQSYKETFFAVEGGRVVSYITLVKECEPKDVLAWVYEYGGDASGFTFLLQHIFARKGVGRMNIVAPIVEHALTGVLYEVSNNWYTEPNRIMKIVNLKSLLGKYTAHMELARRRRGAETSGSVTLVMGGGQTATLEIGTRVTVSDRRTQNVLELSDLGMVRLVFGLIGPSEAFELKKEQLVLDTVFPLDSFMWLTDTV